MRKKKEEMRSSRESGIKERKTNEREERREGNSRERGGKGRKTNEKEEEEIRGAASNISKQARLVKGEGRGRRFVKGNPVKEEGRKERRRPV